MFTLDDLFEIAVKMETNGESVYKRSADTTEDHELKSLLVWMAEEEACHRNWFLSRKGDLDMSLDEERLKAMVPESLEQMIGDRTLMLDDVEFDLLTTPRSLLETFVGFEQDTILFYELLEMFIEDEKTREGLQAIIQEEKRHVEKLNDFKAALGLRDEA